MISFLATGGFIYWNTHVLNRFRTSHEREGLQARYEKTYKKLEKLPQPRIIGVQTRFDIHPETKQMHASGTYQIRNNSDQAIPTLWLTLPSEDIVVNTLTVAGATHWAALDTEMGFYAYDLPRPLAPGESATLAFDLDYPVHGFKNSGEDTSVAGNGTFVNNQILPHIGYQDDVELSEDNARKKYGLEPKKRMPDRDDPSGFGRNYGFADGDWIAFQAKACTSPDQIAIAPGYLTREWTEDGRHCFEYKMDSPIL